MADLDETSWTANGQAERLSRRESQRRQRRRRRLGAAAALVVAVWAIAIVFFAVHGSTEGGNVSPAHVTALSAEKAVRRAHSKGSDAEASAGLVRNATPQSGWEPHTGPVPILEYHVLGTAPSAAPYPELYVTRPDFHRQMDWLEEHGYEAVTLEMVERAWYDGGTLPAKPVVLSFDDGYRPQFTYALPELRRHDWPGVLNLKAEGSDLYTSNVEAMIDAGWELAAHTINHQDLTTLGRGRTEGRSGRLGRDPAPRIRRPRCRLLLSRRSVQRNGDRRRQGRRLHRRHN